MVTNGLICIFKEKKKYIYMRVCVCELGNEFKKKILIFKNECVSEKGGKTSGK